MSVKPIDVGSIKEGSYIIIDGEPCKVVEVEKSKTGKHGSAKVRVVGISVFDGAKHTFVAPVDQKIDVPVIEKSVAQVISILHDTVQLMDLSTFKMFEIPKAYIEQEVINRLTPSAEVEVWNFAGKMRIMRIK
ncbi:MAG: translation initiation factor IF-5A [Candidatus Methanomethylicia archaeon]